MGNLIVKGIKFVVGAALFCAACEWEIRKMKEYEEEVIMKDDPENEHPVINTARMVSHYLFLVALSTIGFGIANSVWDNAIETYAGLLTSTKPVPVIDA